MKRFFPTACIVALVLCLLFFLFPFDIFFLVSLSLMLFLLVLSVAQHHKEALLGTWGLFAFFAAALYLGTSFHAGSITEVENIPVTSDFEREGEEIVWPSLGIRIKNIETITEETSGKTALVKEMRIPTRDTTLFGIPLLKQPVWEHDKAKTLYHLYRQHQEE